MRQQSNDGTLRRFTFDSRQNRIWVGYDDPSADIRSKYILSKEFGGAAVDDDINNRCNGGYYPVLTAVCKTLCQKRSESTSPVLIFLSH